MGLTHCKDTFHHVGIKFLYVPFAGVPIHKTPSTILLSSLEDELDDFAAVWAPAFRQPGHLASIFKAFLASTLLKPETFEFPV